MRKYTNTNLASRIHSAEIAPGLTAHIMRTETPRVAYAHLSLLGGNTFAPQDKMALASITAEMLELGTRKRSKTELRELLEGRGASVDFSAQTYRIQISMRSLATDLGLIFELVNEMLRESIFPEVELASLKQRLIGEVKEQADNTRNRAILALVRTFFSPDHPNYGHNAEETVAAIDKTTIEDIRAYWGSVGGFQNAHLVITGDVPVEETMVLAQKQFGGWRTTSLLLPHVVPGTPQKKHEEVLMKDKTSADVVMGIPVGVTSHSHDFYALSTANFILGGNFTARLMHEVREKQGLTYGTSSYLAGIGENTPGYWFAWGTFAPSLLIRGEKAIQKEVELWAKRGVTRKELEGKKETRIGNFKVSLATSAGLAATILDTAIEGRPMSIIDDYPEIIRSLSLKEVNNAIKKHIDPRKMTVVSAGSIQAQ